MSAYGEALRSTTTDASELEKLTKNLTESQKASVLASRKATEAEVVNAVTKTATASATGVATFSVQAYTTALLANAKAMLFAMATNPLTWILGITAAITGAIAVYKHFNPTIEEQKEKLSELNNEYENTVQELKTLGDEIEKNTKRMNELLVKDRNGTITLIEEDELKKLAFANKLLKEQEIAKEKEEIEDAVELSKANQSTFANEFGYNTHSESTDTLYPLHSLSMVDSEDLTDKELIQSINALYDGINVSIASGDEEATKSLEAGKDNLLSILKERSGSMLTELLGYQEILQKLMNPDGTFDDVKNQEMWDGIEAWKKEIYTLSDSSGEWNTLQIDAVLSDSSLSHIKEEIQQKFADGTLTESDIAQYGGLITALKDANLILEEGQTPASVYLQYLNDIATSQNAVNTSVPDFTFNESNQGFIDSYQSNLNTLSEALSKINKGNLSDSDLLDLLQTFPVLTDKTDDLSSAISLLIDGELERLKSKLKLEGADEKILNLFDNLTNESRNFSLDEILSELNTTHSMIKTVNDETDETGKISVATLQNIANEYPVLEGLVDDYLENKASEEDLIQALQEEYETDLENYKLYMAQKKGEDEDFYDLVVDGLSDDLINKAKQYGIELGNYDNYLEAKLAMDKKYAQKKTQLENATIKFDEIAESIDSGAEITDESIKAWEKKEKLKKEVSDIEEVINGINTSIDAVIPDFRTDLSFGSSNSGSGEEKKFSEDIDWIAKSVEIANNKVEELDNTLANTEGFTERLEVLGELKGANQDLVDATAKASEKYKTLWETEAAKIDPKYVELITGDRSQLEIENFDNEEEYNQVMKVVEFYDRWQDSIVQNNDAIEKLKVNEDEINSTLLEREELNLENHNLVDQESMTVSEKNKWLNEEKRIKGEIFKLNLALATTEEERLRLQKAYDEYINSEPDKKYENGREGRANKTSYYNSRIQDIQNDIALEEARGGQGTEQQYLDMNALHEKNKAIYQADYKAALAKRNGEKWGTAAYKEYNDQVQEAQDNINECTIAQIENNRAILLLPIKQYEDLNKELEEDLEYQTKLQSKIESAIGYATILVQDEIDALNERKQTISDGYDDQIKAIQEQKDALTESNDEIQRQIDLENAKYNLEKAIRNKTTRIYRAGSGFVYEQDQGAVRDAQQELDQLQFDNTIADLDKQIDTLNENKEDDLELIDEEIKSWEEYANKLNAVSDSYERLISKRAFLELFKASGESSILQQDEGILTILETSLNSAKSEVDLIQEKIDANNTTMQKIREEAEAYLLKQLEIKAAQDEINKAIVENQEELDAIQDRTDETEELSNEWTETDANITSALEFVTLAHTSAKESEALILDERKAKLEEFKNAAVSIYSEIASQISKANSAFSSLETILANAKNTYNQILEYQAKAASAKAEGNNNGSNNNGTKGNTTTSKGKSGTIIQKYHSGGIVGKSKNNLPDNFVALTEANLQPNETLAKLLFGEVVLNTNQMGNMVDNLSRTYTSILPATLNKRENTPNTSISIGDVNVYNPDNSDMIVNEIVKELPLKVIQRLNSK